MRCRAGRSTSRPPPASDRATPCTLTETSRNPPSVRNAIAIVPIETSADRPDRRRLTQRFFERVADDGHGAGSGVPAMPAVLELNDAAADPLDQLAIVGRDQHRRAARVDVAEQVHDLERQIGIEVAGRLVGQHEVRLVDERARDRHALLLAARQFLGQRVQAVLQADPLQHLVGPAPLLLDRLARARAARTTRSRTPSSWRSA